jgi:hypothetical protein
VRKALKEAALAAACAMLSASAAPVCGGSLRGPRVRAISTASPAGEQGIDGWRARSDTAFPSRACRGGRSGACEWRDNAWI